MIKLRDILLEKVGEERFAPIKHFMYNRDLSGYVEQTVKYLEENGGKVLFLTTSTRYPFNTGPNKGGVEVEPPKSTVLANFIKESISNKSEIIDVPTLTIYPCEGNVSHKNGNHCGVMDAMLKDKRKNPTGNHRCWASLNHKDDELWKISKELFEADTIIFFGSIRWGQANSIYQKLIERLTWIENRHSTLEDKNVIEGKKAGFICIGQNWNGSSVVDTQKSVLDFFGFETPSNLFWNWQYTIDSLDESQESYMKAHDQFHVDLGIPFGEKK